MNGICTTSHHLRRNPTTAVSPLPVCQILDLWWPIIIFKNIIPLGVSTHAQLELFRLENVTIFTIGGLPGSRCSSGSRSSSLIGVTPYRDHRDRCDEKSTETIEANVPSRKIMSLIIVINYAKKCLGFEKLPSVRDSGAKRRNTYESHGDPVAKSSQRRHGTDSLERTTTRLRGTENEPYGVRLHTRVLFVRSRIRVVNTNSRASNSKLGVRRSRILAFKTDPSRDR
jgi:hypothetical protein